MKRDLEEFARSYEESHEDDSDSVFMRVIKESLWQELADITDKTQLEWREVFQDLNHHGVYHSGEVVGLGNRYARSATTIWRYTPRMCCHSARNAGMTSFSGGHLSRKRKRCALRCASLSHYSTVLISATLKY